jgi:hypothetical protein
MMRGHRRAKSDAPTESNQPCEGVKAGGGRCSSRRIAGSSYCFFHDPDMEAERKAAQSAGGQKNRMAVLPSSTPDAELRNAEDASKVLAETINQVRRGEIDPKIANSVGYLIGLFVKVKQDVDVERRLAALESALQERQERWS